jgi:outer membrane biosynthesis protein TonB
MTEPDDRDLERYLEGGSPLSRRYRDAGGESTPPELDEVVLARARAELRREPKFNRYLAPVALAASLVLAVNLAWNLRQAEPLEDRAPMPAEAPAEADAVVAAAPPASPPPAAAPAPEPKFKKEAPAAPPAPAPAPAPERREAQSVAAQAREAEPHALIAREVQAATRARLQEPPAAGAASDEALPLTENQKIDRLIAFVAALEGAVFIRNERHHTPAEAAKHLQLKRGKAGDRVRTADDFIRLCASHSTLSGEAYLIRLADGRTRTAEDVLREELARIEGR